MVGCAARAADADAIQACVEALPPAQHQAMVDTFGAKMGAPPEPALTPSSAPAARPPKVATIQRRAYQWWRRGRWWLGNGR